jgi:ribosome-binding protein aMBF1 (putative translation factor)
MAKVDKEKQKVSEKVGDEIRKAREKAGLSQEKLSAEAGFYRTYVGHVEVGRYTPSIYTLYKIAKALKIKVSSLIPF